MTKPITIDQYVAGLDEPAATLLGELRDLSREAAPTATEAIKWGCPAHLHARGTILFVYSAHKHHANFTVTPSTKEAFEDELTDLETGKGSVKLPYGDPLPRALLRRLIAHRIEEFEQRGVTWM
ncbi:iron chaperone [Brachybacterium sacelli]|uniref:Uncharacterized protein YdhG (YjbR/CyaY superfamily) n=1 Tax=Brachybacterium sacelli TaxID=173364 RepID=A0ABS4X6U0_9MICO|nr:DUF1801 domain-containing protein [Brachybacterium sacelli]MBP2384177.1 uncharacterized protein YdhG (YjbR/CyaY superfamily) [Brachybacterium sacelli]